MPAVRRRVTAACTCTLTLVPDFFIPAVDDPTKAEGLWEAIKAFNFKWARRVLRSGATVVIISDGWDRGDPDLLAREMARLQRSSRRLIWLNPLLGAPGYQPLTQGMRAALPFIDEFMPIHNLQSLEALARQYVRRYGVVFRDLLAREPAPPWRDLVRVLRRLEMRGELPGGRLVAGFVGEQFASPEALDALRALRREPRNGERVRLSACDPLNLVGILTPGPRVPATLANNVLYEDGAPVAADRAVVGYAGER